MLNMRKLFCVFAEAEICDQAAFMNLCSREGIILGETESPDACHLRFFCPTREKEAVERAARQCGGSMRILQTSRAEQWKQKARLHRLPLVYGGMMALLLLLSSLFVWEIELDAPSPRTESWRIRAALDRAGLRRGAFVPGLSTELLSSKALEELPELESLTVNVRFSRAFVEAREREKLPEIASEKGKSMLVAKRETLLTDVRVYAGTAAVNRGMAVEKGDVLLLPSSTSDRSRGEVMGLCRLEKTALLPQSSGHISPGEKKRVIWGFQWGKRCIFLQTDSSISPMVCGKMYSVPERVLPFGFFRLSVEKTENREAGTSVGTYCAEKLLEQLLARELGRDGELLSANITRSGNALTLKCECSLNVGEEIEIK